MRRLFWVALGAAAGVAAVRTITKKAKAFTPKGVARSVAGLGDSVREFMDDVRAGMAERESELAAALEESNPERLDQLMHTTEAGNDGRWR